MVAAILSTNPMQKEKDAVAIRASRQPVLASQANDEKVRNPFSVDKLTREKIEF